MRATAAAASTGCCCRPLGAGPTPPATPRSTGAPAEAPPRALSWALMPRPRLWKPFILASSYVFYAASSVKFCFLLASVALTNQLGARLVHRAPSERRRKQITAATVAFDLGVLGLFKY